MAIFDAIGLIMSKPIVGVVTVTYNAAIFLDEFFQSCSGQDSVDYKVYCIDNASSDLTCQFLRTIKDERWNITFNQNNVGVARGNNQGIIQALSEGCEWVLLLNNDTVFDSCFFERLLESSRQHNWSVVVPKIYLDTPKNHIWYGGGGFKSTRGFTGFHEHINELDEGQCDSDKTVDYSPTCAMLIHKNVFGNVGLMDESYFVYFDDTDFCWRLHKAGLAIGYTGQATLVHKVGGSTGGGGSVFTAHITARNRLFFIKKHFGSAAAWFWIPVFLLYYLAKYVPVQKWSLLRASIAGTFAFRRIVSNEPKLFVNEF
jgi:GT2 family glycosyltransferase